MKYIWIGISLVTIVVIVYFITSKKSGQVEPPKDNKKPMIIVEPTSTPSQSLSPTSTPVPTTAAPVPTTAPQFTNWTPYGSTIFTSPTQSSFQVGVCDINGVQYRQCQYGSVTLTEYMNCSAKEQLTNFAGTWDTCVIDGINYGPVKIADGYGGSYPTITAGSIPFPADWATPPTLVFNDVLNVQNSMIRSVDNSINEYIGQVAIYYNYYKGERIAIRVGTKGSNYYLSRNLNKSNKGYDTISGNIYNNVTLTPGSILNVVSDGSFVITPTAAPVPTTAAPVPTTAAPVPTPSQTPFFATTAPKTTVAPTSSPSPTTVAPTSSPSPTTMAPTSSPSPTTMAPTSSPSPTTVAPTAAPTASPLNWTPYGATIFTSRTESSFQVGACDENGVQYRQTISGSPTLSEYMNCGNTGGLTFAGIWDTCIIRGIDYGPVTFADQRPNPTITAGTTPFPENWSTPTLIRYDNDSYQDSAQSSSNVRYARIRSFEKNIPSKYAINDIIGQVVIYYNRGERVAIRIGTKGSNCYLSRNLNKLNQGYTTITGNIHNNFTTSTSPIVLNVVSDGSLY